MERISSPYTLARPLFFASSTFQLLARKHNTQATHTRACAYAHTQHTLLMRISSEPLAAKMTSLSSTHFRRSVMRWMLKRMSGYSAARASARGRLRFRSTTSRQPLLNKCFTRRVDILPAPIMQARASSQLWVGSLSCASSTAAELTDTEPVCARMCLFYFCA